MGFSEKQREIFRFPYTHYEALICDGAVRSGKTSVMSLSFLLWAMGSFDRCAFAICGKSVGSVERNIITPLLGVQYLQQYILQATRERMSRDNVARGAAEGRTDKEEAGE